MTVTPADHRYLQVARALRKDIVDGVYPVGSQLPTEHELCERFSVSRYTVREALRRLRDDNLVVVAAPRGHSRRAAVRDELLCAGRHVDQRPARLRNRGPFAIESKRMVTLDDDLAARTGLDSGEEWLAVRGFRQADAADCPLCRTEYYINRAFAAVGRLLQRHTGPIFPLIEDLFGVSIVEVHQEIAAVLVTPELADGLKVEPGTRRAARCSARTRRPTARSPRSRSTPIPRRGFAIR